MFNLLRGLNNRKFLYALILSSIVIDGLLLRMLFNLGSVYATYLFVFIAIVINLVLIGYIISAFSLKNIQKRETKTLEDVLDDIVCLAPLGEEEVIFEKEDETEAEELLERINKELESELFKLFNEEEEEEEEVDVEEEIDVEEVDVEEVIKEDQDIDTLIEIDHVDNLEEEIVVSEDEETDQNTSLEIEEQEEQVDSTVEIVSLEEEHTENEIDGEIQNDAILEKEGENAISDLENDESDVYKKPDDLEIYLNDLHQFILNKGIEISRNSLREIFAAMAASKVIIFRHENSETAQKTIEAFFKFIGIDYTEISVSEQFSSPKDLFGLDFQLYDYLDYIRENHESLNVLNLKNTSIKDINNELTPIVEFSLNPLLPVNFNEEIEKKIVVPENMWISFVISFDDDCPYSERLSQGVVTIDLDSKVVESNKSNNPRNEKMSFDILRDLLVENYENYYMGEPFWQQVDEIEKFLTEYSSFEIDNRLFRQLERYSSTFLIFGGEKSDVIDSMIYCKLSSILSQLEFTDTKKIKQDLLMMFDKLFGLENLSKTKIVLKEILEKMNDVN